MYMELLWYDGASEGPVAVSYKSINQTLILRAQGSVFGLGL